MARSGNESVSISINTVNEDAQAFDALNRQVEQLKRNLRDVSQESKSQMQEMKQETGELDTLFEDLGGTISNSFLSLAGVAGVIAGIGAQAIQTIQEVRREGSEFNIDKTALLISTGDAGTASVSSFDQQFADLRRKSDRTEQDLLKAFSEVRPTFQGEDGLDRTFEVLQRTELGPSGLLAEDKAEALREYVARAARLNPNADLDQLERQGEAMLPMLGNQANQMESIMEGAEQAATMARDRGEDTAGVIAAFNEAVVSGAANLRVNQGADVVRAAIEGVNEAMQMVEDPETGEMRYASPAIANVVNREGFGAGLSGMMSGRFDREEMTAAGIQGIDYQEFAAVARMYGDTKRGFQEGESDFSGVERSLGPAALDLEIDRTRRETQIAARQGVGQTAAQRFSEIEAEMNSVFNIAGTDFGIANLAAGAQVLGELTFGGGIDASRRAESELMPAAVNRDRAAAGFREGMSSMRDDSRRFREQNAAALDRLKGRDEAPAPQQRVQVDVQVSAPDGLNVQSEVN
jgi:hypothetical protein